MSTRDGKSIRYIEALPGSHFNAYNQLIDLLEPEEFVPFFAVWREGFTFSAHQHWVFS